MNTIPPCYEIHPDDLESLATSKTLGLKVRISPNVILPGPIHSLPFVPLKGTLYCDAFLDDLQERGLINEEARKDIQQSNDRIFNKLAAPEIDRIQEFSSVVITDSEGSVIDSSLEYMGDGAYRIKFSNSVSHEDFECTIKWQEDE